MIFQTSAITTRGTPRKITARLLEFVVENFNRNGRSVHTLQGVTLAPLLNYLVKHEIQFTLKCYPKSGFYVVMASHS